MGFLLYAVRVTCVSTLAAVSVFAAAPPGSPPNNSTDKPGEAHDPLNRDTPQSSVFSFLEACRAKDYARALRYMDLEALPQAQRLKDGSQLAQQLSQVLDRDARFDIGALSPERDGDEKDSLPPDRELLDTFVVDGRPEQLELEHKTLHSGAKVWLFAPESLQMIPKLVLLTSSSPIEKHLPPPLVNWTLLGTALWRWIVLLLLALILAGASRWLSRLVVFLADRVLARLAPGVDGVLLKSLIAPLQLIFPVVVLRAALAPISPSPLLRLQLERGLAAILFLGIAWLCARFIDLSIGRVRNVLTARRSTAGMSMLPLASRVVKLLILLLAVTAILSNWGYNTSTILAGLGVGGLAIALAAQKTVENLFGGVAVISDQPVSVGDYCRFGDRAGTVEDIGLRSTRVRTVDRTLVSIPNGLFSAMTIENFARQDKMLFHITLNLRRDTKPGQVRSLLQSIGATLAGNPKIETGATPVRFVGVGTYSLDLEIFVYIRTRSGDEFLKIQQDLLLTVLDEIAAAGTALALPTQASISDSLTGVSGQVDQAPVSNGSR